ncbi:MAG TPA: nuclear transport factor 2 family protein [Ktedonobacterales bacterium]
MKRHIRLLVAGFALLATLAVTALSGCGAVASAQSKGPADPPDQDVIASYIQALNAGIQSGDFTALVNIYAPDGVLTASTPKGTTTVATGSTELLAFFQGFRTAHPGLVFAVDSVRILQPHYVLTYEHASPPGWVAPGRCMHLYTIQHGKVQSLDWATFYGGKQV